MMYLAQVYVTLENRRRLQKRDDRRLLHELPLSHVSLDPLLFIDTRFQQENNNA